MIVVTSLAPPRIRSACSWAVTAPSLDLWHTCATLLLGRGVHPKLVHHHLGHASITMNLDRYSHWIATMGRHAADGIDEPLGYLLLPNCCQAPGGAIRAFYLFTVFAGKKESRRADSNR